MSRQLQASRLAAVLLAAACAMSIAGCGSGAGSNAMPQPGGGSGSPSSTGASAGTGSGVTGTPGASDSSGPSSSSGTASSSGSSSSAGTAPGSPTGLAGAPGHGSAILTWNASAGAEKYQIYRSTDGSIPGTLVGTVAATRFTDEGLASNWTSTGLNATPAKYSYVIAAVNDAGVSPYSSSVSVTPDYRAPSAPENFTATAGDGKVTLAWTTRQLDVDATTANAATAFRVYRDGALIATVSSDGYTDAGLANGTAHSYTVAGVNGFGQSPDAPLRSATPVAPQAAPATPSGLKAAPGDGSVSLAWNPIPDVTSYSIYRDGSVVASATGNEFVDTQVSNGTTYQYQVAATSSGGTSALSLQAAATPAGSAPATPSGLTAAAGNTYVTLTWQPVGTATGYNVYRNGSLVGSTLVGSFTDVALQNSSTYSYRVSATDAVGESNLSSIVTATPSSTSIPAAGSWVKPYSVGYQGDPALLTEYSPGNGAAPDGCTWESYGLRCDQTNLLLDHVHLTGGLYWTGTGSLTITNSIVEGELGIAAIEAHTATPQANAVITVTDSTLRWALGSVMPPGNDTAPIWNEGGQAVVMIRCDSSGMPQGIDPTPNSLIDSNYIHGLFQNYASGGYPSDTHLDGIYSQGGSNILIQRNYVEAPVRDDTTAALFIQNRTGTDTGIRIYANYFNGGGYVIANQTGIGVDFVNNLMGEGLFGDVGYVGGAYPGTFGVWTGNVYTDGSSVPVP